VLVVMWVRRGAAWVACLWLCGVVTEMVRYHDEAVELAC
jgi:hypothetical protein